MFEYLKAIYDIVVANNKFLKSLEERVAALESSLHFDLPPLEADAPAEAEGKEETINNNSEYAM